MSARRYQLEVFDLPEQVVETVEVTPAGFETAKLEAYEKGYAAGWDDALNDRADAMMRARAELVRQLQDVSFTHLEARQIILKSVDPLIRAIVETVLPEVAREMIGPALAERLASEVARRSDVPLMLHHHPSAADLFAEVVDGQSKLTVTLKPDPALTPGQFILAGDDCEVEVDLDRVCADIRGIVADHLDQLTQRSLP